MNSNELNYENFKNINMSCKSSNSKNHCNCNCGGFCKCENDLDEKIVFFNDNNYTIFKIENWKNNYKVNILGLNNEIPITEFTKKQSLDLIENIRRESFLFNGNEINGMVGLAIQFNNSLKEDIENLIAIEEKEYINIRNELNNLKLENENDFIELETTQYLIYKLKESEGIISSKPANDFTKKFNQLTIIKNSK